MIYNFSKNPDASTLRIMLVNLAYHQLATQYIVLKFCGHFAFVFAANVYSCLYVVKREIVMIASILFNNLSIVPYFGFELLGN